MTDASKLKLGIAAGVAKALLSTQTSAVGLPNGTRVVTNSTAVARFPLPLTIASAVIGAIGVIAVMRGYKITGSIIVAGASLSLAAAAAAPELTKALNQQGNFVGKGPQ